MEKLFKANLTSDMLVESICAMNPPRTARILDLGCGDGNIALRIARKARLKEVCGSDVSQLGTTTAKRKAADMNIRGDYRLGAGFTAWKGERFDLICCDVAAISSVIADASEWYDGVSCETGISGLDLLVPLVRQSSDFLNPGGALVLPSISLSARGTLLTLLGSTFDDVKMVMKKEWPLPELLSNRLEGLGIPLQTDNWCMESRFGLIVAFTEVYVCKSPVA